MNRCELCFNFINNQCETMTEPFRDYSCFMTKARRITAQEDMIDHSKAYGTRESLKTLKRELIELNGRS